jgi:dienelactone hydrolase
MYRYLLLLCCIVACHSAAAQMATRDLAQTMALIQAAPSWDAVIDSLQRHDQALDSGDIAAARSVLWQRLQADAERDPALRTMFETGAFAYAPGKVGHFKVVVKGVAPSDGYPVYIALHGGGGGPQEMNDEQWAQMQQYYLGSIDTGIYIAPRGPNNTWNLHFDDDAQAFYSQLLRATRLFAGADPNRIYLLGYSAGGDGVYQLAPRLASQLAAASMSAGHHNGVRADNLQHVPMLLQVGESDTAYNRNRETVRYGILLDSLERRWPGAYRHQVYVHAHAAHSYVRDRQGAMAIGPVLTDPRGWLANPKMNKQIKAHTDAPTWLARFRRNPFPAHLRWDATTAVQGNADWYWLSLQSATATDYAAQAGAEVRNYRPQNRIEVIAFSGPLQLHLHESLVDLARPVEVIVDGRSHWVTVQASLLELARSMARLGDAASATWATVSVTRDASGVAVVR